MRFSYLLVLMLFVLSCQDSRVKEHPEWQQHFEEYGITEGCFMLRDQVHEVIHFTNKDLCLEQVVPASTFKIVNSLIALETGVAPDDQLVIPWDSVERQFPAWNKDMNMREAFETSNLPYYQELARRIGAEAMKYYLDTINYGNKEMGDQVDQFWIDGSLKISVDEQVGLVKRIYFNELKGFSERSQRIVRSLMLREETPEYRLYYKTGWGEQDGKNIFWVVGFTEQIQQVQEHKNSMNKSDIRIIPVFFAQQFKAPENDASQDWVNVRIEIMKRILKEYGALPR